MTHPLAISFVLLAGSLLEAGSRLRLLVGREAGRGGGEGAREAGAFHTTGASPQPPPLPPRREG